MDSQPSGEGGDKGKDGSQGSPLGQHNPSLAEIQAAQALEQATQKFADAQRATGEGAAAVANQQEIANQPLREALDIASNIGVHPQQSDGGGAPSASANSTKGSQTPAGEQRSAKDGVDSHESTAGGERPSGKSGSMPPSGSLPKSGQGKPDGSLAGQDPTGRQMPDTAGGPLGQRQSDPLGQTQNGQLPGSDGRGSPDSTPLGQGKAASGSMSERLAGGSQTTGSQGAGSQAAGQGKDISLGAGLVPNSPEITAAQIAGDDALAAAAAALGVRMEHAEGSESGQGDGQPQGGEPGKSKPESGKPGAGQNAQGQQQAGQGQDSKGQRGENRPGAASSTADASGTSNHGGPTENQPSPEGMLKTQEGPRPGGDPKAKDGSGQDSDVAKRQFKEDPWVAKLPPELRKAIRAKSQRPAPKGYEDRLQRYFENID
jgi:hypothetical protein